MNLEKEYKIPIDIYRDGYREYQKKYVYPKNYVLMAIFLVLAANFVYGAVNAPDNVLAYLLIVLCLAMAFKQWYDPRKIRESFIETIKGMEEQTFRLTVSDTVLEISTVTEPDVENSVEESEDNEEYEEEAPPKPSVIPIDKDLNILEYDRFFLAVYGKAVFYIIPKGSFSQEEIEAVRKMHNA